MKNFAEYRLVYLQPTPEDGEKICIAIFFVEDERASLSFDNALKRAKCISDGLDLDYVRSLLNYASHAIARSTTPFTWLISTLGTQFSVSEPRQVVSPIRESIRQMLLERFVIKRQQRTELNAYDRDFGEKVKDYAFRNNLPSYLQFVLGAEPKSLTGKRLKQPIRPVALAISSEHKSLLIDGVDFNLLSPKRAIQRVGRVNHTFWQYDKLRNQRHLTREVQRVAMLFNGVPRHDNLYKDAHDYAIHQLKTEADVFIDASSSEGSNQFEKLLYSM